MRYSVVLPTYNRAGELRKTLRSLAGIQRRWREPGTARPGPAAFLNTILKRRRDPPSVGCSVKSPIRSGQTSSTVQLKLKKMRSPRLIFPELTLSGLHSSPFTSGLV